MALFYLTDRITFNSERFVSQQTEQRSPLPQFTVSGVHAFSFNVPQLTLRFYSPCLKEAPEIFSFGWQTQMLATVVR
jgi:hypothetical protein